MSLPHNVILLFWSSSLVRLSDLLLSVFDSFYTVKEAALLHILSRLMFWDHILHSLFSVKPVIFGKKDFHVSREAGGCSIQNVISSHLFYLFYFLPRAFILSQLLNCE